MFHDRFRLDKGDLGMYKDKFQMILQKDEEIKWCDRAIPGGALVKNLFPVLLLAAFFGFFVTIPMQIFLADMDGPDFTPFLVIFPCILFIGMIYVLLDANNTFFCITDKRVIKRSGAFGNHFVHYTLKNVGTINVRGGIGGTSLSIVTKDFHTDSQGNVKAERLNITALHDAYSAYAILSELAEGNNESLRVKLEK